MAVCFAFRLLRLESSSYAVIKVLVKPNAKTMKRMFKPLKIFISYRRDDSAGYARGLYDSLNSPFPFGRVRVFMDVTTIEPGANFVETIENEVSSCDVLVAVIGQQWLTSRLQDPEDLVRREIATALDQDVAVIPVLVQGATMPGRQDLPDELARLAQRHALELSNTRWDYDIRRLKKRLGISFADRVKSLLVFLSLIIASVIVILGAINYYPTITAMLSAALTPKVASIPPTSTD
jgi:hypothetical protein